MNFENNGKSKAADLINRILRKDQELGKEWQGKFQPTIDSSLVNKEGVGNLLEDYRLNLTRSAIPQTLTEESIVLAHLRPVLMIRDNRIVPEFSGPEVTVWKDRLMQMENILNAVIPAVGRIEVSNNAIYKWVGTGWLIDDDILVTNRHVASLFCKNKEGFSFKIGFPNGLQSAKVDFLEEDQRTTSMEFKIDSVLWMSENSIEKPDVAFMRIKKNLNGAKLPNPIELSDSVNEDDIVVTIGYPARNPDIPDKELVLKIFGDVYDKKRLAPGEIISINDRELEHDCTTLGGNSGSPIINLATGKAVGLHFAGRYMYSNFGVPSSQLKELLKNLKLGKLPRMNKKETLTSHLDSSLQATTSSSIGKYTFDAHIPIKITVEIGGIALPSNPQNQLSTGIGLTQFNEVDYDKAIKMARELLSDQKGVISVGRGYRFRRGWVTDERVIVVEVQEKQDLPSLRKAGNQLIPQEFLGFGVDVRTAGLFEQLEFLGIEIPNYEAVPRPGVYQEPPHLHLAPVKEEMKAIFHVSPDSGWPNLREFFGRIKNNLTATIYEWEAEHITDALFNAINTVNGNLKMVTQKTGTEDAVTKMKNRLGEKFEYVWASVGSGRIIPSAYHIKVASRDEEEFWLSSGNWKDSNQADINPAKENSILLTPLRKYNREWHVIIQNKKLATLFKNYIDWDFDEATRVPLEEAIQPPEIYLFVPEPMFDIDLESKVSAKYFEPLIIEGVLDVQPLLTPDRNSRGQRIFMDFATTMIENANSTIDIENQSFNLLEDNEDQFERFFTVLKMKQQAGVQVRIIFRDPREFGGREKGQATLQKLLDRIKEFGLDTDNIKAQIKCHSKAIIVDSQDTNKAAVLFGSHNLTNSGALFNRDASLLIKDVKVAQYFQKIFNFDWEVLANQSSEESVGGLRIARKNEETPIGFRKVTLSEVLGW